MTVRHGLMAAAALLAMSVPALAPAAAPTPPTPKLVVAVAVDQFAWSLFSRYRPTFTGGLATLGQGLAFLGYQSHAATETCPGHSTILTGDHPARTGIVANTWFDRATGSSIYCVSVAGVADPHARGGQNLRVDTLGDWLKRAQPAARVVSVSGKDRAAIMLGGHHADAVYWWNDGAGFGTSPYAGPATPAVLAPAHAFNQALFARWRATPPALWPTDPSPACRALERPETFGRLRVSGRVPPDASLEVEKGADYLAHADFQDQLRASPLFDTVTADFAEQLIAQEHLGRGPATDLLAVSLSATDYVGHRYGNGGAEMCVQLAQLDRTLAGLVTALNRTGVPYLVVLTADHGGVDAAERATENGQAAQRLDPAAFVAALNAHLRTALDLAYDPVVGDDPQQLVVNVGPDAALRARVVAATLAWARTRPEVAAAFTADEVRAATPPAGTPVADLTLAQRFHESYDPERSGDVQVAFKPGTSIGLPRAPGDVVAGHGAPWDHDRQVPILFWWPGVVPVAEPAPIETVDIAPTLAAVMHVPAPPVDGHCLPAVAGADCPGGK